MWLTDTSSCSGDTIIPASLVILGNSRPDLGPSFPPPFLLHHVMLLQWLIMLPTATSSCSEDTIMPTSLVILGSSRPALGRSSPPPPLRHRERPLRWSMTRLTRTS